MNANERRWALMVVGLCMAGGILATLGRFFYEICFRWPFVCLWFERIGAFLLGYALGCMGTCFVCWFFTWVRRIARRQRGPVRTVVGCEDGFIRFR